MGKKYASQSASGFNSSPPGDDASEVDSNKLKWSYHINKIGTPIKDLADAINTQLVEAFDEGPDTYPGAFTTVATDHMRTLECSGTFIASLLDASTAGAGYTVTVKNNGSGVITVDTDTAGDQVDGETSVGINAKQAVTFTVNNAANGYYRRYSTFIPEADISFTGSNTFDNGINYATSTGTDVVVANPSTAITAYQTGAIYNVLIGVTNQTATPTLNISSKGAKTIKKEGGNALLIGDLPAGHAASFMYDGTDMMLQNPRWPSGSVIQVVDATPYTTNTGLAVTIDADDTIPDSTEGTQILTASITPLSATSRLRFFVNGQAAGNVTEAQIATLAKTGTTPCIAVGYVVVSGTNTTPISLVLYHEQSAGGTSAQTFTVQVGSATGTFYPNGLSTGRLFGGISSWTLSIEEIAP